jgi:hypothetical protein
LDVKVVVFVVVMRGLYWGVLEITMKEEEGERTTIEATDGWEIKRRRKQTDLCF